MKIINRYNLLEEPWLKVIESDNNTKKVSLLDIFQNSNTYKRLAGDTDAQNFVILRLLLSVLETTFSNYDYNGNLRTDKKNVKETWPFLWKNKKFPFKVIEKYLISQEDKFYLYSDRFPFLQVSKKDLTDAGIKKTGTVSGRLINRLISESNNKLDLFSPSNNKSKLSDDSLARWMTMFVLGYTGTSDKAKYPGMKESASKGNLLGLGGIYLEGNNLFETLMLNLVLENNKDQKPIWEADFKDKTLSLKKHIPDNLSELYTNCSRLIYIDPNTDLDKQDAEIQAVQLPGISKEDVYGHETMTLYQVPKSGKSKGKVIPKMHESNKSLWRNFGLIEGLSDNNDYRPGIINDFYGDIKKNNVDINDVRIVAVGMTYNHDPSGMLNGEIYDSLDINREIFNDISRDGYVEKIYDEAEITQKAVITFKYFVQNVMKNIRNVSNDDLVNNLIDETYFAIDEPFKNWIANIDNNTDMIRYPSIWRKKLYNILVNKAESYMYPFSARDLMGTVNPKTNSIENIITKYKIFKNSLRKQLNLK